MACEIAKLSLERYSSPFGIQHSSPRISWSFSGDAKDWVQKSYQIRIHREGGEEESWAETSASILVPWPSTPLRARERATISVRANSTTGQLTSWASLNLEVALLNPSDWSSSVSTAEEQPHDQTRRPFLLRKTFLTRTGRARLYITALGLYRVRLNDQHIGDHVLAPGWQSYNHRLHYQCFDVSSEIINGENVITADVGEGWYCGRLGFAGGKRNIYGTDLGLILQLEVDGQIVAKTGEMGWESAYGALVSSEIYDGEHVDYTCSLLGWNPARTLPRPNISFIAPEAPPVRRQEILPALDLIITPSGKTIIDFGQNLVGWVRFLQNPPPGTISLRHAEVLEHGELGTRPLRYAACSDSVKGGKAGWEPVFTFHGFRYAEVDGWAGITLDSIEAVAIYSDMERLGDFDCSHRGMRRFHENTLWGLRGNFVSVPTDCPQRDERLGWTGDLQVFAPTASYLYQTCGLLGNWLEDLRIEQAEHDGVPPLVVPNVLSSKPKNFAIWGDVTALAPQALYDAFGDVRILRDQWESMVDWLERGVTREPQTGLWDPSTQQLGDWLDPTAPEDVPDDSTSDTVLVANCFLVYTTSVVARVATILGLPEASRFKSEYERLRTAFQHEYLTPSGNVMSDTQTTLALVLRFNLTHHPEKAAARLDWHIRRRAFKIRTGFAGTPVILPALAEHNLLPTAYRMFQEKQCPSILYPISMGATTIWERWNSMLPDGTINPGEMTSFNHYALGSVSQFLYETVGGLSLMESGWKRALIRPRPGGTVTSARVSHLSPYGLYSVVWAIKGEDLEVVIEVPPNTTARVELPDGTGEEVGSGKRTFVVKYTADTTWPPKVLQPPPLRPQLVDEVVL